MYYYLLGSMTRRLILELQDSFSRHPAFKKVEIANKYSFNERPHFAIVVKGSSGNKVVLSANNFVGTVHSHVMLSYLEQPAYPLEWVREDLAVVQQEGRMPTDPGVYFLEVLSAPTNPQTAGSFILDPLYTVTDEPLAHFPTGTETKAQLRHAPAGRTLRLWRNQRQLLKPGVDYQVEAKTGKVTFLLPQPAGSRVTADYRYPGESIGPQDFYWNTSDSTTLPGVVLAFGKRAQKGDKVAVSVFQDRNPVAEAYGGKYELSFDLDVIATDPTQMEEMADLVVMYLTAEKKPVLEFEGIELLDVSMGGTSEESYDDSGDMYFYTASLSVQFRTDWEIHIPQPLVFSKVTTEKPDGGQGLQPVNAMGLYYATTPTLVGRNHNYERIK